MTSTRILGCVLRRNCLTARNALFRCDAFFNSKCRASLHMKTQANMRIEPNKWCEKLKGQDTKKIEFGIIKKNKEAGKDGRDNLGQTLRNVVVFTLTLGSLIYAFIKYYDVDVHTNIYMDTLIHCVRDPAFIDAVGAPVAIVPRKKRIANIHRYFKKDGVPHEQFTFYVAGPKLNAMIDAEVIKHANGTFEFVYVYAVIPKRDTLQVIPKKEDSEEEHSENSTQVD